MYFDIFIINSDSWELVWQLITGEYTQTPSKSKAHRTISLLSSRVLQPDSTPMVDPLEMQVFNSRVGTPYTKWAFTDKRFHHIKGKKLPLQYV